MKKVLLVSTFALLALASCKKDYICTCTTSGNGASASSTETITDTKKNAKATCEAGSSTLGSYSTTCTLN
jgi:hypothetical protein